jgi:CubicO group peptidase (beta-lactamase class C family)
MHEHGSALTYNNSGLLVMLIERVAGSSYTGFIRKRIFERLVMSHSGYDPSAAIDPRKAIGYSVSGQPHL